MRQHMIHTGPSPPPPPPPPRSWACSYFTHAGCSAQPEHYRFENPVKSYLAYAPESSGS
ncbi:hypothetical protein LZ31DRAFT_160943 [Colletotrichum somersetense]|nr:hypothetical protein LZ31DRAFT_160943 [Colletotrichum somersetense]